MFRRCRTPVILNPPGSHWCRRRHNSLIPPTAPPFHPHRIHWRPKTAHNRVHLYHMRHLQVVFRRCRSVPSSYSPQNILWDSIQHYQQHIDDILSTCGMHTACNRAGGVCSKVSLQRSFVCCTVYGVVAEEGVQAWFVVLHVCRDVGERRRDKGGGEKRSSHTIPEPE